MSYDLIESTLIRLGEQMPDSLSASFQSRADLPSARRCDTKRQKPERAPHEKDRACLVRRLPFFLQV